MTSPETSVSIFGPIGADITESDIAGISARKLARFWGKIDKSGGQDACWPWLRATLDGSTGYGRTQVNGRQFVAHRLAYAITHGSITGKMCVCHRCDFRRCCNPSHLFLGTHDDNMADRLQKAGYEHQRGERNPVAKLNAEKVRHIRRAVQGGVNNRQLARQFGVAPSTIDRVVKGERWGHVS